MGYKNFQRGAILAEYAIATAILVPIFIVIAYGLEMAIRSRGLASVKTVEQTTPSNPYLSALRMGDDSDESDQALDKCYQDDHGVSETRNSDR